MNAAALSENQLRDYLIEAIQTLPTERLREVADIVAALRDDGAIADSSQERGSLSLREIVKLPVGDRHKLLSHYVADTAEDFANDSALTEFAELDVNDWDADYASA